MKNLTFKAAMLNDSRTTVNRQSTDGQSQRHYKQTPLSKRWKVLMTLVFLFTFAIGQMWAGSLEYFKTIEASSSKNSFALSNVSAATSAGGVGTFTMETGTSSAAQYYAKLIPNSADNLKLQLFDGIAVDFEDTIYLCVTVNEDTYLSFCRGSNSNYFVIGKKDNSTNTFAYETNEAMAKNTGSYEFKSGYTYYIKSSTSTGNSVSEVRVYHKDASKTVTITACLVEGHPAAGSGGGGGDTPTPDPSEAPTINTQPSTTDVQYLKDATGATALSVEAEGNGTLSYQWYKNTSKSNTGGTALENCTTATYTPSTAAEGKLYYYCAVTNTESGKSATTVKSNVSGMVRVVPAPTHLVENVMATSGNWDSYIVSTNAHISNLKTITASDGKTLIKSGKESASSPRTPGITSNSSSSLVEGDHIYVQFTIEDGYELTVSDASVRVFSISNPGKYVARISDNASTPNVIETDEATVGKSDDADLFEGYDFSDSPKLSGTVTLKLFAYGWSDGYRMKSPLYIDGTVTAKKVVKTTTYDLTTVKVNGTAISDNDLATLKTADAYKVDLTNQFVAAPTVKFARRTTITYTDDSQTITNDTITVTASEVSSKWQAQATIGTITYTVKAVKVNSFTVNYYDGSTSLGSEVVGVGSYPTASGISTYKNYYTFTGWTLGGNPVELANVSAEAGETVDLVASYEKAYATSINIEKLVMQNGKSYNLISQLGNQHYASNITGSLDSLSVKKDSLRNYSYLGLKVKQSGALLNFRLGASKTVKIKFGNVATKPQVSINGGDYAEITITDHVYAYTAEDEAIVSIKMMDDDAVVFQQIMIDEEIQAPELYPISYATTDNGSIAGLKLGIPGENIKVYPTPTSGYVVNAVTVNGNTITPTAGVYSFTMPNEAVAVAATFAVPSFTVTYNANNGGSDPAIVDYDASVIAANTFTYADHIFLGWNTEANGTGAAYTVGATVTEDLMLYAQWLEFTGCFYFGAKSVTANEDITAPATLSTTIVGGSVEATYGTFTYTPYGVLIAGGGDRYFTVTLDKAVTTGSKITITMVSGGTGDRGLNICYDADKTHTAYTDMHWDAAASEEKTFEYTLDANSAIKDKKVFYLYRNNNVYLKSIAVEYCAPQDYTVTYMDGAATLGTEIVYENEHPTADGINTHKKGYEFQGWAETVDGAVVDLDDITITAAKNLFAQYTVKDCSPKGVKFSMAIDGSKISANQYYPNTTPAVGDLAVFATVTGGVAQAVNTSTGTTKNFEVKTTPEFKLGGSNSHMRILLDCPLAENDTIKFTKSERIVLSFDSLKTKKENIAKNTSYYIVPATYAGEDTIHIWYDNNGVSVNGVQVIRPEIYSVSFELNGHSSAIAPIDVVKGAKITAPTAPEDEDYAFAGWYKENTLSNEWKFDVDVVTANTTLYAKWLDKSDATLKSLKYGATDIALQDGVYEYNVELPALSTSVPALTAETSNPNATKVIANATAFDESGNAQSTVTVTPQKEGAATQTYIVNFAKAASVALQDVTGSITWDFNGAVTADVNINNTLTVIANYAGVSLDGADKLEVKGTKFMKSPACVRANQMHFYTTVPGKLTVEYSNTGGNTVRYLYVNGVKYDEAGTESTAKKGGDTKVFVPAGDVELVMMDGSDASKELNIYRIIFNATPDYERPVSNNIGTLCVEHNVPAGQYFGATFYQIASRNADYDYKIDFEEVLPTEELKAGEPYIFQSTTGKIELFFGETEAENPVPVRGMIGNFAAGHLDITDDNKSTIYYFAQNKLWNCEDLVESGLKLNDHRAYIDLSQVPTYAEYEAYKQQQNNAPRRRVSLVMNGEQVATGIENGELINGENGVQKVLINGKLFILRGEKMYDVTGKLVK